ncbi:ADP-ribose pyrophosphatase of COG1058 family [hydrothermal vent metagenome]|uniref:ADP-ribose pyrophosphatase of COG1058 family n=1 Tax=hydrothermal vent metagenome TaxID=652676 RepID=A0A3B0WH72_9ZZZZ
MNCNDRVRLLIIGDEILSGKRQDRHLAQANDLLKPRGLHICGVTILGDEPKRLTAFLQDSFAKDDLVFCFGGIGATPDDRTRQCAAKALSLPLERHPEAVSEIEAQFGEQAYPLRIRMAEFPKGAAIIPNEYNRVPSFSIQNHYFMPGFPVMAKPMMAWVLEHYGFENTTHQRIEKSIRLLNGHEADWIIFMEKFEKTFPDLRLFSLPSIHEDGSRSIELGVEGEKSEVQKGLKVLIQEAKSRGCVWHDN